MVDDIKKKGRHNVGHIVSIVDGDVVVKEGVRRKKRRNDSRACEGRDERWFAQGRIYAPTLE